MAGQLHFAGQPTPRVEWCPERGATRPGPASGSNESKGSTTYSVYIARCSDGTLYVGHTGNLELREKEHNEGRGARYTAMRRPVRLVYTEAFESLEAAIRRERQLKHWSRAKKDALVAGDLQRLKRLSKRRS
jgi:putative endonuclease